MSESQDIERAAYKSDEALLDALTELPPLLARCSQLISDARIRVLSQKDTVDGVISRHSHREALLGGSLTAGDVSWYTHYSQKALSSAQRTIYDLDDAVEALTYLIERLDNLEGAFDDLYSRDE